MKKTVIGLDFGSDSVRALLAEAENGRELATAVHEYSRWKKGLYCNPGAQSFRQHPLDYLEGMETVVREVLKGRDASQVAGIGIDTTGSTPCAVDEHGIPLSLKPEFAEDPDAMFILWKDHTAAEEAARINRIAESSGKTDYTKYEGGIYSCEWFWAKILHVLRTDERVGREAFSWVEHCDWIPAVLTGNTNPLTLKRSRCAAGHKAMWHRDWNGLPPEEFLREVDPRLSGLRARLYSETCPSDVRAGTLSPEWAARLGLPETVAVGVGAFDCHFGAVGAGIRPKQLVKVVGTSTCDMVLAPEGVGCVRGICGQVDGSILPGKIGLEAGQSAFGDVYAWFRRLLEWNGKQVRLEELEAGAAAIPPGSDGLLALDWLNGRRTPDANPFVSGALFGLRIGTTAPMIFRALVESTAFGARKIAERFREEGIPVDSVTAVGGISRKSPLVMQICADVLNMPIRTVRSDQVCALGAAMFAAVNAGLYEKTEDAMNAMGSGTDKVYHPDPHNAALYEAIYQKYCRYGTMTEKEIMNEL